MNDEVNEILEISSVTKNDEEIPLLPTSIAPVG
jgi:hypothetical protein